ncbi:spore photoproduct lyase [Heliorestis acidaminivorans]|uniref:Spore photoproduct lyase n=2 Tax=Heliorestis acidaminivorans TaxID=553427 RepID=A0A6I0F120_9FIRM|nr:spore photoproduct lyase [Heliorestis acidaminivorans]
MPHRMLFESEAYDYPLGQKLLSFAKEHKIPHRTIPAHNRVTGLPGASAQQKYSQAKKTIVVGLKKDLRFQSCRPSADYQFPLMTSCPGHCEYCYLQTTLGQRPYLRVYVNIEEILEQASKYVEKNSPSITTFEVASSGDPLSIEHLTGSLGQTISFFGQLPLGRLRFVTKFTYVDPLLSLDHQGHCRFRFSLNSNRVVEHFEHHTASIEERIEASVKVAKAGYPLGFIIAPIMLYPGWFEEYGQMIEKLKKGLEEVKTFSVPISFELIQHRFTTKAKKVILERFPDSQLDLEESQRKLKFGKYGVSKYVYKKEEAQLIEEKLSELILKAFPTATIEYFT